MAACEDVRWRGRWFWQGRAIVSYQREEFRLAIEQLRPRPRRPMASQSGSTTAISWISKAEHAWSSTSRCIYQALTAGVSAPGGIFTFAVIMLGAYLFRIPSTKLAIAS